MLLWPASLVLAQGLPQGASKLEISTYKRQTNAVPVSTQGALQGPSKLNIITTVDPGATSTVIGVRQAVQQEPSKFVIVAPEGEKKGETESPSEQAKTSRISFLMNTGVQYTDAGEYKEAEQVYLRALESAPGDADIIFRLSTLYIQMKRYADAVMLLRKLEEAFPDSPMIQNNLAWVYATGGEMKNGPLAVRYARETLLSAPYTASLWNTLAEAYYISGQYEKALRSSDMAIDLLRSQEGATKEDIAAFEAQRGKIQRAGEAYKRMLKLDDKE